MPFAFVGIFLNRFCEKFKNIKSIRIYFDEILTFGNTFKEHLETLIHVLKLIEFLGLTVRKEKCKLFREEIKFLGYIIGKKGCRQDPEKIRAIDKIPYPENKEQLQTFIGMINYYRKFIPNLSNIEAPLIHLLKKG